MPDDKIVQFVTFETILCEREFISRWEKFTRSDNNDKNVVLHQAEGNGFFKYLVKHSYAGGFKFIFEKQRRSSKDRQVSIKVVQEGGYFISHLFRGGDCQPDESKVFCFIQNSEADLKLCKEMIRNGNCNVYSAYYENCRFAYVLEFFAKDNRVKEMQQMLTNHGFDCVAVYKECLMQLS